MTNVHDFVAAFACRYPFDLDAAHASNTRQPLSTGAEPPTASEHPTGRVLSETPPGRKTEQPQDRPARAIAHVTGHVKITIGDEKR